MQVYWIKDKEKPILITNQKLKKIRIKDANLKVKI